MFQQILIAWDASRPAVHAFDVAIDIARRYDGEIIALSVAQSPRHAETHEDRKESVEAARRYLEGSLASVRDRAGRVGVPLKHVVLEASRPSDEIVRFAHEHGVDLIVVGRHTSGRAGRLLLRGVSDELARMATLPLLIVGEPNGG
jgi:nucleotide-binding universal stress UspA family protein